MHVHVTERAELYQKPMPIRYRYLILRQKTDEMAGWLAGILGFSIPISTAGDNILLGAILILWLIGDRFQDKFFAVRHNPIVLPILILFSMYVLGLFYGEASWLEALSSLKKAAIFLLIPIMIPLFREEGVRRFALGGFMAAILLTLLISYLMAWGIIPQNGILKGSQGNPLVFKYKITQSFLMAFGAYLFALKARLAQRLSTKLLLALISLAAIYNVLFIVTSKTGYFLLLVLTIYFFVSGWRWRGAAVALASLLILGGIVYFMPASLPHQRLSLALEQFYGWHPGQANITSVGQRMEYYANSIKIVRDNPLLGVGTGGFKSVYARYVQGTTMDPTDNPHNEYLMVTTQLGMVGLGLMLWLFFVQWRSAGLLMGYFEKNAVRGLILLIMSASLVTSTLIDHTEGLLYVWMSALLFTGRPQIESLNGDLCHSPSS